MDDLFLLGRMIFGGFFLYNGANHFLSNTMFVQYTAAKGVPMPDIAVAVAGLLIVVGGFCVGRGSLASPRRVVYHIVPDWRHADHAQLLGHGRRGTTDRRTGQLREELGTVRRDAHDGRRSAAVAV